MKPDEPAPAAPRTIGLPPRTRRPRIYYAIFLPLGLLGFCVSFYLTYQRNEPLQIPSRLPLPSLPFPSTTASPLFEEGPPPPSAPPPAPSR
jgi:hypothetical protein